MKKVTPIVIITIGEAPRRDIADTYDAYFSGKEEMVSQIGLLDNLSLAEAEQQLGADDQEATLISTYRNGVFVKMSHAKVEAVLQETINQLEKQGVKLIVILCTAEFKQLRSKAARLIEPEKIILPMLKARFKDQQLGVVVPLPEQRAETASKWQTSGLAVKVVAASPYEFNELDFKAAIIELNNVGVETIILDCMGYNRKMKSFLTKWTTSQIYQSNELLFDYLLEESKKGL